MFVCTFPFESITVGSRSLAKLAGLPFFALYFFYYNPLSKKGLHSIPAAFWWFLGYLIVYAANGLSIPEDSFREFMARLITLTQLLVFFWIASSLLKSDRLTTAALIGYGIASVILAAGFAAELPGFSAELPNSERATALGANPNTIGYLLALAGVAIVGLKLNGKLRGFTGTAICGVFLVPLLIALVKTGSRTAAVAFVIGCAAYGLPPLRWRRIIVGTLLGITGIGAIIYITVNDPFLMERWDRFYYEGSMAGREEIMPEAIGMIIERPLVGWQPVEFRYELARRVGLIFEMKDAHSLFLHLLLEVGALGAVPFFFGLFLCAKSAWKGRVGKSGLLPLALLLTTLAYNMAGTGIDRKPVWFALALAIAAGAAVEKSNGRRVGAPLSESSGKVLTPGTHRVKRASGYSR